MASFSDTSCKVDGACPNDPLHFTCEVNEVSILRVVLPSGEQETITVGDEVDRIPLPAGFTAVSLDITDIFGSIRNFVLTLSIASASLLAGGKIRCDDGSGNITATAGCVLVGELKYTPVCYICFQPTHNGLCRTSTSSIKSDANTELQHIDHCYYHMGPNRDW